MLSITRAHVQKMEGRHLLRDARRRQATLDFDFAMLLPPFRGADLQAFDRDGADITAEMFAPSGFLKVDADYTAKPHEEWSAGTGRARTRPRHGNVFGIGIAFAPPHQISVPRTSPRGTVITPAPPRTGMPSGLMGVVADNIADMINGGATTPSTRRPWRRWARPASPPPVPASARELRRAMTMYPVVPDYERFPERAAAA